MKKSILVFFSGLLFSSLLLSQDVHFSQPYSSPLNLNPAFAGSSGCARAVAGYRTQWVGFQGTPKTFFASYDQYVNFLKGGVGINYYNDKFGDAFMTNRMDAIYSAHIPFFKGRCVFKPAAEVSFVNKREKVYLLNWGTSSPQAQPSQPFFTSNHFLDLSFGGLLYSKRIFVGTAFHHINEPEEGFFSQSRLPMKYTFHLGGNIGKVDSAKAFVVTPSLLYVQQEDFREFAMSCKVRYDKFSIGAGYRNNDALILSAGFQYNRVKIEYSYDTDISGLKSSSFGSPHEISLAFTFNCKNETEGKLFLHNTPF